ncbi:ferredoxin [Rhodobium orientis]|uniref:Ferredoxin n=1 Tax=Rhodobium orientis TaxID=34017 RepID=A0A327JQV8_9HYPH|nr:4Fe-4S dicluster domain-containing protein [Rhodobium orientis]MBB4304373.1 ferredoxin [Rhodobium orientis]MBK5951979.1 ferredoxin [Rhodobium orientis]RAI25758.1 ferredoxin [Rhodobium orientis]
MAYEITAACVNCFACMDVCPSGAIREAKPHFLIDAAKCTHCEGDFADPQCASICPVEMAILNEFGEAANPQGSLTGIPLERLQALAAAGIL